MNLQRPNGNDATRDGEPVKRRGAVQRHLFQMHRRVRAATAKSSKPPSEAGNSFIRVPSATLQPAATRTIPWIIPISIFRAMPSGEKAFRTVPRHIPTMRCSQRSVRKQYTAGIKKSKMRVPIFTGALGSTEIARKNWEHFAGGCRHLRRDDCLRGKCLWNRPGTRSESEQQSRRSPRYGPAHRGLQALPHGNG